MLLSHEKKFIFLKTIKTAGTSVEVAMQKFCAPAERLERVMGKHDEEIVTERGIVGCRGDQEIVNKACWRNHMTASNVRDLLSAEIWDEYFKFSIVRNPYDRIVSMFHFKNKEAKTWPKEEVFRTFTKWIERSPANISSDRDIYLINGAVAIDHLIRYENLENEFRDVCISLDIVPSKLPRYKHKPRGEVRINYREYYDAESKKAVEESHAFEFDRFGYKF